MERRLALISGILFSFFCYPLSASIEDYFPIKTMSSASNYGETGLLETPNAKFMPAASMRFNFSSSFPFEFTTLTASPFSWLEATYRYTEIKNQLYGPFSYSGNQSLKDKGFDLKVKLLNERYYMPAVALGLRDIAGTGLFSSEYLVATKSIGNLDISTGLGFGNLGLDNNIKNPFTAISANFETRTPYSGGGGEFSYGNWFSGPAASIRRH